MDIPKTVDVKFKFNPKIQLDGEMSTYDISEVGEIHHTNTICIIGILKALISSYLKHKFIIFRIIILFI